ncbi:hypothetical protein [Acinetobacter sp. P1(2025)]|uniref:hypothetical protein n=1 Tax=Acinetobacter sp. P1(2025) TaxID=3446120 RepID=UPI003F52B7FE
MNKELLSESLLTVFAMILVLMGLNYYAFKDLDKSKQLKSITDKDVAVISKEFGHKFKFVKADMSACVSKDDPDKPYTRYDCNVFLLVQDDKGKYLNLRFDGIYDYWNGMGEMFDNPLRYYNRKTSFLDSMK